MSEEQAGGELEATVDDIFGDVRDLVSKVPDSMRKQELAALVDVKKERFDRLYVDGLYQHNVQDSYSLLETFIREIEQYLRPDDNQSHEVAAFLMQFCKDMYDMWGTRGKPAEAHFGRIEERMLRYYTTCPASLRMAKFRRKPKQQLAAMRKSMRELCGWVKNWSDACDEIKKAKELVPSSVEDFTETRKAEVISCLMNAYEHLLAPGTGTLIKEEIKERMELVEKSDAYVEGSQVSGVQDAQAGAGVGELKACMHALLRQLDTLK